MKNRKGNKFTRLKNNVTDGKTSETWRRNVRL